MTEESVHNSEVKAGEAIMLTGDRPSGLLHIGHYAGSLAKRLELQDDPFFAERFIMIADMQALTDHAEDGTFVSHSVLQLAIDYLACGLSPEKNTIYIQSLVPELCEYTMLYMNFVTLARLKRNPTVKNEMQQKGFGDTVPSGFLNYPLSQAADITSVGGTHIPVGEDQLPMIEQTNEIVRHINSLYHTDCLRECQVLLSRVRRLPGTDGGAKMGKSLGNSIYLSDDEKTIREKVMSMYTDPGHIHVSDPGKVEGNPVFTYLEAFDPDQTYVAELEEQYRTGGLGDVKVKKHLLEVLLDLLNPIRARRLELEKDPGSIMAMLRAGSEKARGIAAARLKILKAAMGLTY